MDEVAFWSLVDECRASGGADSEQVARLLWRNLRAMDLDEIRQYWQWWDHAVARTFVWPVQEAADLMFGRVGFDTLWQVQDWIISHGRDTVDRILSDADNLAELAGDRHNAQLNWFAELPVDAYLVVSGGQYPEFLSTAPEELRGVPIDVHDPKVVRARYPKLCAYRDQNRWIADA